LKASLPQPRTLLAALALLLLMPCLGIPFQDRDVLEEFHNRALRPWPSQTLFLADPVNYFVQLRAWLSDRAFPIQQAAILQRKVLYYVLDTPPQKHVTVGRDGFIFLNGASDANVNGIFDATCARAHTLETSSLLQNALVSLAGFVEREGIAVDIVIVPTPATLYGDFLPGSVPEKYRALCRERTAGRTPLLALGQGSTINLVFPLLEMLERRLDEGFFPKGNWHPVGLSQKILRDTYLHRLGVNSPVEETLVKTTAPAEILRNSGIEKLVPVYNAIQSSVAPDAETDVKLTALTADFFPRPGTNTYPFKPRAFKNRNPVIDEAALMVSDSYGFVTAPAFAAVFRQFVQVMTNDMRQERLAELIGQVQRLGRLDRIIMLVQEGDAEWIGIWSQSLKAARPAEMQPVR
jgi:hypothetical protein